MTWTEIGEVYDLKMDPYRDDEVREEAERGIREIEEFLADYGS